MYSVREMKMFLLHPRPLLFGGGGGGERTGRGIVFQVHMVSARRERRGNYLSEMHINILLMEG